VVNLNVLPGGQVVFARAVFVTDIEDGSKLVKAEQAHRDFDANHLNPRLSLPIHASGQSEASEPFLVDGAFPEPKNSSIQIEDVLLDDWIVDFVDETKHGMSCQW
jgi:hypothetical protein